MFSFQHRNLHQPLVQVVSVRETYAPFPPNCQQQPARFEIQDHSQHLVSARMIGIDLSQKKNIHNQHML